MSVKDAHALAAKLNVHAGKMPRPGADHTKKRWWENYEKAMVAWRKKCPGSMEFAGFDSYAVESIPLKQPKKPK